MQADRGLVEHVERVDQARPERGRQRDALGLAARKGPRLAVEREVVEADPVEVVEAAPRLPDDPARDGLAARSSSPSRMRADLADLQCRDGGDIEPAQPHGQGLGPEPRPVAVGAGRVAPPSAQEDPDVHLVRLPFQPPEKPAKPGEPASGEPLDDQPTCSGVSRLKGTSVGRPSPGASVEQVLEHPPVGRGGPGGDRPVAERLRRVGDDPVEVKVDDPAEPLAGRAGSERAVVAEQAGVGLGVVAPAAGRIASPGRRSASARRRSTRHARAPGEGRLDRVEPPSGRLPTRASGGRRPRRSSPSAGIGSGPVAERGRPGRRPGPG